MRAGAALLCLTLASLALPDIAVANPDLIGQWKCTDADNNLEISSEIEIKADNTMSATLTFTFFTTGQQAVVTATYLAKWRERDGLFWDIPQMAEVLSVKENGSPVSRPPLEKSILAALMAPPEHPMRMDIKDPEQINFHSTNPENSADPPIECLRVVNGAVSL